MNVLNDILDNLSEAVTIIDSSGRIVLFNTEAMRICRSVSEKPLLVGEDIREWECCEHKQRVIDILKAVKRQKKPVKNFAEYKTSAGCHVCLEVNYIPVIGADGKLKYINIIAQDITDRKLFERKLRASAAEAHRILEDGHAVIVSIDSRGYIVEWNSHCAGLTGFRKKDVLSKRFTDLLTRECGHAAFRDLMAAILENKNAANYEFAIRSRDGAEKNIIVSATSRANANGHVIGATLVGQDITELTTLRRSMEKLVETRTAALQTVLNKEKEALELKSRFVSIASHEFRTPLSSIDFAASFIKRNAATIGSKKLNEKVEVIERHVNHMNHLLEDVLNFSRNEAGKIQIVPSEVDLDAFLQTVVEEVICSCRHSHHVCVSTNKLGSISTDEKLLRNILINLMTNAIKYSPGKEEISLNVLQEPSSLSIEVRDDGIGIPQAEIGLIFQPFVRGKGVESIQGTGLGLSIVKKSVELLGGMVEVSSRPGKGSVFKVKIPHGAL